MCGGVGVERGGEGLGYWWGNGEGGGRGVESGDIEDCLDDGLWNMRF